MTPSATLTDYPQSQPVTDAQIKRYNDAYNTYLTNLTTAWQKNHDPLPPSKQQQQPPSPLPPDHGRA